MAVDLQSSFTAALATPCTINNFPRVISSHIHVLVHILHIVFFRMYMFLLLAMRLVICRIKSRPEFYPPSLLCYEVPLSLVCQSNGVVWLKWQLNLLTEKGAAPFGCANIMSDFPVNALRCLCVYAGKLLYVYQ